MNPEDSFDADDEDARFYDEPDYNPFDSGDCDFADPGGNSALRAESPSNPRNLPCPTCGEPNRLTPADKRHGYQCDACATRDGAFGYGRWDY